MNAARGTRRPHSTRPYKRGRKASRTKGGKKGCALWLLLFVSLTAVAVFIADPAHAASNTCTVTPNPVPLGSDYTITAQLRPAGWYSIRVDQDDHFGHHAEGAPYQADPSGLFTFVANTTNGPRDSLEIGEAQVHIRPVDGTGGGGAHCRFEVVP